MNKKILLILLMFLAFISFTNVYADDKEVADNEVTNNEGANNEVMTIGSLEATDEVMEDDEESVQDDVSQYKLVIEDDAKLLKEDEVERLRDKMSSLTKYGHIAFKSIDENPTSAESYAEQYYHEHFGQDSGTLFLIDMDNRKIYIFSDGKNYRYITTSKANSITDNIYRYASDEEYYECAYNAYDQMQTILEGGKIAEPMRYTSNAVIAIVIAFFINFLVVLSHSKIKSANYSEVANGCNIDFNLGAVDAEKTGTHRVYSPQSSGGSSGGGGGGGGGSSGGGGGHSF